MTARIAANCTSSKSFFRCYAAAASAALVPPHLDAAEDLVVSIFVVDLSVRVTN